MANLSSAGAWAFGNKTVCLHENTMTCAVGSVVGCETTAQFCIDCGQRLSEETTDCR